MTGAAKLAESGTGFAFDPTMAEKLRPRAMAQFIALSKRSLSGSVRQLPLMLPSLLLPMFFVAINSASFEKSLPLLRASGYPKLTSYLTFTLAATVIQGILFGCVQGATDLATDIELGFFERLIAAPANRGAILVSRLAGSVIVGVAQSAAILVAFGARIAGGVTVIAVLLVTAGLLALAFGGLLAAIALKTGSAEVVQSTFPVVFILLFLSSAFFPRLAMRGLFKQVAGLNPITHLVEAMRTLIINGWSGSAAVRAIVIPLLMATFSFTLAARALRSRLVSK
jgi:ABC-2 type transport system permease protein